MDALLQQRMGETRLSHGRIAAIRGSSGRGQGDLVCAKRNPMKSGGDEGVSGNGGWRCVGREVTG